MRSSLVPESVRSPQVDSPKRPSSPSESAADGADWNYARREAVVARLNGTDVDLETLGDQDLNRFGKLRFPLTIRQLTTDARLFASVYTLTSSKSEGIEEEPAWADPTAA